MKIDNLKNRTAHDAMVRARMVKVGSLCDATLEYVKAWEVELEGWLRETKRIKEQLMREYKGMCKYRLHWLDGHEEVIVGFGISDACKRAGLGGGAMNALDCFEELGEV